MKEQQYCICDEEQYLVGKDNIERQQSEMWEKVELKKLSAGKKSVCILQIHSGPNICISIIVKRISYQK